MCVCEHTWHTQRGQRAAFSVGTSVPSQDEISELAAVHGRPAGLGVPLWPCWDSIVHYRIWLPVGPENPNSGSHTWVVSSLLTDPSTQSIVWLLRRPLLCRGGNVLERGKHRIREFSRSLCLWFTRVEGDPGEDGCSGDGSTQPKKQDGWHLIFYWIRDIKEREDSGGSWGAQRGWC